MCNASLRKYLVICLMLFVGMALATPAWACKGCGAKGSCAKVSCGECGEGECSKSSCAKKNGCACEKGSCPHAKSKAACGGESCAGGCGRSDSQVNLGMLKDLAGYWESKPDQKGNKEAVVYKTTSGGTVVQEILFPSTNHEMVSMYHNEGGDLVMTHYCSLGNQPKLKASRQLKDGAVEFEFVDGTNMRGADMHIHNLRLSFLDKNHIKHEWLAHKDGRPVGQAKVVEFERKP